MYFEYPYLLFLLAIPVLLVLRYLYIELRNRRVHLRVSKLDACLLSDVACSIENLAHGLCVFDAVDCGQSGLHHERHAQNGMVFGGAFPEVR